jgi:hypothetical protein
MWSRVSPLLVVLAATAPAPARAEVTLGMLGVATEGEVPADLGPDLESAVIAGLRGRDLGAVGSEALAVATARSPQEIGACADADCLGGLAGRTGIDGAARLSIRGSLNVYAFRLEALSLAGRVLASVDGGCDICNHSELLAAVEESARRLAERMPRTSPVTLAVSPDGALLRVDGEPVTGTEVALEPGEHVVSAEAEGFAPAEARVEVVLDSPAEVRLELERARRGWGAGGGGSRPGTPGQGARALSIAGWVLFGGGLAAVVAGVVDIGLDGTCYGDERNSAGVCAEIWTTLWTGVGLVAGGAAVAGVGLALALVGRARARQARGAGPLLWLGLGPAGTPGLSAAGRF